jgi:hypothetical protein
LLRNIVGKGFWQKIDRKIDLINQNEGKRGVNGCDRIGKKVGWVLKSDELKMDTS